MAAFWDVAPYSLVVVSDVSEELIASIVKIITKDSHLLTSVYLLYIICGKYETVSS
jgi:hypothetical protein